ncbi:hypothetical protein DPSP01_013188 [Paraphaeosphaeria sporulosa]
MAEKQDESLHRAAWDILSLYLRSNLTPAASLSRQTAKPVDVFSTTEQAHKAVTYINSLPLKAAMLLYTIAFAVPKSIADATEGKVRVLLNKHEILKREPRNTSMAYDTLPVNQLKSPAASPRGFSSVIFVWHGTA